MAEPSLEQWRTLYDAAIDFQKLAPWQWMNGDNLFAVENPSTGEAGYANVMGQGGQEFGLALFLGDDGFAAYRQLWLGEDEPEGLDAVTLLRSLSVTFVDRDVLQARDLQVIRSLGLRFRGRNAWPWFRSQQPRYMPWFLEPDEAGFLEVALRQAIEVAQQAQEGTVRLTSGLDDQPLLTRCCRQGTWLDEWRPPPPEEETPWQEPKPADALRLQRLQKAKPRSRGAWQLDLHLLPAPIGSGKERPYYPLQLLAVTEDALVAGTEILEPWASATEQRDAILKLLEKGPSLPREIQVRREAVRRLLAPAAKSLGIAVRVTDLEVLEAVEEELLAWLT